METRLIDVDHENDKTDGNGVLEFDLVANYLEQGVHKYIRIRFHREGDVFVSKMSKETSNDLLEIIKRVPELGRYVPIQ